MLYRILRGIRDLIQIDIINLTFQGVFFLTAQQQ
ncbi:unknown [Odoribacter splanchnicus CAG:14]|nr:unknown [Odoribacter splanchnicus CAG:14]